MATPFLPRLSLPLRQTFRNSVSRLQTSYICQTCAHQSTYRRTRKAIGVKPDESFRPSKTETQDHIIHNPPSSLPNIYHTPSKFLPATDPRHKRHHSSVASYTTATLPDRKSRPVTLPPPLKPVTAKKYHLTLEQVEEIRRLRAQDPRKWTRASLAEKFDCSPFFVSLCCATPRDAPSAAYQELKEARLSAMDEIKKRWGLRKRESREARRVRKDMWGRDA